jgi:hypothetical protein
MRLTPPNFFWLVLEPWRFQLPDFQAAKAIPTNKYRHEMGWLGLPSKVFANAFLLLLDTAEGLEWQPDSCPSQDLEKITTKLVVFSLFAVAVTDWDSRLPVSWTSSGSITRF